MTSLMTRGALDGENDEVGTTRDKTHSVNEHRHNDLYRKFKNIVPRHVHIRVLVLIFEAEFGS